ncbi:F0F1 ATP synthase subunit gamma [Natronospira proteinivora]|nr:F0F1 ATP synthase subunit gamma [Natronospira proteinivora]
MSGAKEIRTQIKSIGNTQKITKAMEMVAASKMRRAQDRMEASRPYAKSIRRVIGHLANANPDYRHPYLIPRDPKRVNIMVISTDRGLCGGLNVNLFKSVLGEIREWRDKGVEVELTLIGAKASAFFSRLGLDIVAQTSHLGDTPHLTDLIGTVRSTLNRFDEKEVDLIRIAHNEFINTMTQQPEVQQLLPVEPSDDDELLAHWDYIYEPKSPETLLEQVLTRYVESQVYQGVVENVACEQAARMVAMKAATDNAGDMIESLQLEYNKARQAAITQELAEIVSGAAAV